MFLTLLVLVAVSAKFSPHEELSFLWFMRNNGILYTGDEYHFRFGIYLSNLRYVQDFNSRHKGMRLGMNSLSALSPSEYLSLLSPGAGGSKKSGRFGHQRKLKSRGDTPSSWDWRSEGVVQPVRDSSECPSDWAFIGVAAQESMWAITNSELYELSWQNLVDCNVFGSGCGTPSTVINAYDYVVLDQDGSFVQESDYPNVLGSCGYYWGIGITYILGYGWSDQINETEMAMYLYEYSPPACHIDASHVSFQLYSGGIYDEPSCSSTDLNHFVMCVGYGNENGTDYWIVENCWGTGWGEAGYIRMSRNKDNQCGIATNWIQPLDSF